MSGGRVQSGGGFIRCPIGERGGGRSIDGISREEKEKRWISLLFHNGEKAVAAAVCGALLTLCLFALPMLAKKKVSGQDRRRRSCVVTSGWCDNDRFRGTSISTWNSVGMARGGQCNSS